MDIKRTAVKLTCGPSRTKQSFRDQVNINSILARYRKSGLLDHVSSRIPFFGDVSGVASYQDALAVVKRANDLFNGMSSVVREKFKNDPMAMIEFLQKPENFEAAVELGMVVRPPVVAPEVPIPPVGSNASIKS